jgi:2-polyprenyl-6-hydroxyphenyl methylase/3-demethylubiquinone-9 3-methyltransferase
MADCASLTDDDGLMFVATINRTPLSWLFAIFGAEYVLRWLPKGTHRWRWFRKPDEIETMLRANGLSVIDIRGVAVNPLSRSMHIVAHTAVNYMLTAGRAAS